MKLNEYQKPSDLPGWLEKSLISQQYRKLIDKTFISEVAVAKKFYQESDCKTLIDIGCWLGVLSYQFKKEFNPPVHYLIDAVPIYLYLTKKLFQQEKIENDIEVIEMTISENPETATPYFLVNINDTLNTSNFIPKPASIGELYSLPIVPAVSCRVAANKILEISGNDCYLKMDIDSVDYGLIEELLSVNFYPRVLHFEARLYNTTEVKRLVSILDCLKLAGFQVPDLTDLLQCKLASIIVSRRNFKVIHYIR